MARQWIEISSRVERASDERVVRPAVDGVLDAVMRLDGATYSEVSVESHSDDASYGPSMFQFREGEWVAAVPSDRTTVEVLLVCGGPDRVNVAWIRRDDHGSWDQDFLMLSDPSRGDEPESRVCGGQAIELPARWWVTRAEAIEAVEAFSATFTVNDGRRWEHSLT